MKLFPISDVVVLALPVIVVEVVFANRICDE